MKPQQQYECDFTFCYIRPPPTTAGQRQYRKNKTSWPHSTEPTTKLMFSLLCPTFPQNSSVFCFIVVSVQVGRAHTTLHCYMTTYQQDS
mmetsp:Transcript_19306/g.41725  ORF Transcript_19306/g.41725 Transcript_19306/m.41725 type:complete len:89 (+) Transcript_19306:524-790(+)